MEAVHAEKETVVFVIKTCFKLKGKRMCTQEKRGDK